ncbi:MAG: ATP phosphoribosyltransferase regulatory subunit [Brevinematales bacterium]|nr:ATP phosphoribosyltransferase regulatory subunit [Brevinematales bacterium]
MKQFLKNVFLSKKDLVGAPRGFAFEYENRKELLDEIYRVVIKKGFKEVSTPTFDFFEVYEKVLGSDTRELFVFKDNGDFIVPRYDTTIQIVRFLAPRIKKLELPVKLFYYSDVFREPVFEWYPRQVKQFGVEVIGGNQKDFKEILIVLKDILDKINFRLGIGNYKVVFNLSTILEKLLAKVDEDDKEILKYLLSNKDLPSVRHIVDNKTYDIIQGLVFMTLEGSSDNIRNITHLVEIDEKLIEETNDLYDVFGNENVIFDPTLVPDMNYYSGIFFKVYSLNLPDSVATGGRYDKLTEKFGYNQTAMGFAIDVL